MIVKKALVSVSDKTNIVEFVSELIQLGYEIISTGGTYRVLKEANLKVTNISDYTKSPEILNGRVKTLHPKIHGGILARRDDKLHQEQLQKEMIDTIDLVCVNLYPFKKTIEKENCSLDDAIENIDIGGPTMLRAAAKNYDYVTVVIDTDDYQMVIDEIKKDGQPTKKTRLKLAAKVFRHTASYDAFIANYLTKEEGCEFPEQLTMTYDLKQTLRYGENPHQKAAFYVSKETPYSLASATQLHGKELSYNNIQDANAALQIVKEFDEVVVVALKHMNPCGVATGSDIYQAFKKAYEVDPISIFGGIVATNTEVNEKVAKELTSIFLEIIIAPSFTEDALKILKQKKNLRLLKVEMKNKDSLDKQMVSVNSGLLIQDTDDQVFSDSLSFPTKRKPTDDEMKQLSFAYKVVKHVKSNAIVLVKDNSTVGVGAGQMNRVGAAKIAIEQAKEKANGAVMASDAFFPMSDTVETAALSNVRAIIQPGGSIRDQESIDMCDKYDIAMVFTHMRHFKH